MMNFRMKKSFLALAATACCCLSCIEINYGIGSDLMPQNQIYTIHTITIPIEDISMEMADSLSGYSSKRITVGAVRDDTFGLTTRACALTLIPMFQDTLDLGRNPRFQSFHFSAAKDTVSFARPDQERIFQTLRVYELAEPLDASVNFDCNLPVDHLDGSITRSSVVYTGDDSLSFNFNYVYGNTIYNYTRITMDSDGAYSDYNQMSINNGLGWSRWEEPGDIATHPKLQLNGNNMSNSVSSRYLEDGSYLRLKNVTVSYTLPKKALKKMKMQDFRIFLSGDNLFTLTRFSGTDPEVRLEGTEYELAGMFSMNYPVGRVITLGVNFKF